MKNSSFSFLFKAGLFFLFIIILLFLFSLWRRNATAPTENETNLEETSAVTQESTESASAKLNNSESTALNESTSSGSAETTSQTIISPPLLNAQSRITKKPFGIYVTPSNSPVQPEKFSGYHTGVDFEATAEELNQPVTVAAVCAGKIIFKDSVNGYGGVIVQTCELPVAEETVPVTVLYGHLSLSQEPASQLAVGQTISAEDQLALLADDKSPESGGERKHLHLGIHLGSGLDFKGYVPNEKALEQWLDAAGFF